MAGKWVEDRKEAEQLLHIFVEVSQGRGKHGSFVTAVANAYVNADGSNRLLILDAAKAVVQKYGLEKYLDNFEENQ